MPTLTLLCFPRSKSCFLNEFNIQLSLTLVWVLQVSFLFNMNSTETALYYSRDAQRPLLLLYSWLYLSLCCLNWKMIWHIHWKERISCVWFLSQHIRLGAGCSTFSTCSRWKCPLPPSKMLAIVGLNSSDFDFNLLLSFSPSHESGFTFKDLCD